MVWMKWDRSKEMWHYDGCRKTKDRLKNPDTKRINNKINVEMVRQKLVSTVLKEIENQRFIEIYFPSSLV